MKRLVKKSDLQKETAKYDLQGQVELDSQKLIHQSSKTNIMRLPLLHRLPFQKYYESIENLINADMVVLELGAECGNHTAAAVETKAKVYALDVSQTSLEVCKSNLIDVRIVLANMEDIPMEKSSIDVILSCGSLSYGDPTKVLNQINRILKPGGSLIILDSLNHNLVYRINRWIYYLKGNTSRSTLKHMPTQETIELFSDQFDEVEIKYFGTYLWMELILSRILGNSMAHDLFNRIEKFFPSKRNAFKFLLVCRNFVP